MWIQFLLPHASIHLDHNSFHFSRIITKQWRKNILLLNWWSLIECYNFSLCSQVKTLCLFCVDQAYDIFSLYKILVSIYLRKSSELLFTKGLQKSSSYSANFVLRFGSIDRKIIPKLLIQPAKSHEAQAIFPWENWKYKIPWFQIMGFQNSSFEQQILIA